MPCRILMPLAILAALVGTPAAAQTEQAPGDRVGRVNAAEYIRGLLNNERYDPRDRDRALNGAPDLGQHWRSSIFDGRRTRATRSTGLRLPDLPRDDPD